MGLGVPGLIIAALGVLFAYLTYVNKEQHGQPLRTAAANAGAETVRKVLRRNPGPPLDGNLDVPPGEQEPVFELNTLAAPQPDDSAR
jgi:hypothetical protein